MAQHRVDRHLLQGRSAARKTIIGAASSPPRMSVRGKTTDAKRDSQDEDIDDLEYEDPCEKADGLDADVIFDEDIHELFGRQPPFLCARSQTPDEAEHGCAGDPRVLGYRCLLAVEHLFCRYPPFVHHITTHQGVFSGHNDVTKDSIGVLRS
ncbi:hypothetical protein CYMTET_12211 [Cymbomonas tetramitiformis]|uniref:Uncharacterized protein n=1 Tax=Cymbomonas tetramitiformis TaxID=36881 RepID=A0AAE0GL31_9CHLO|nr:hypothetical protein CYMTET_12211 [Cymbomonas tetramitiformis]